MIVVIIPNFNGCNELKTVYQSLYSQTLRDFKVILVDNGSSDDSVAFTEKSYPNVIIIRLSKNYGFAFAINRGIEYALRELSAECILLLNNDIELTDSFLQDGIDTFLNNPEAGFIAVKMKNYYARDVIDDAGDFIKRRGGSPLARGHGEKDEGQYDKEEYIFGACAGAAFYRTELFRQAGLFDEDFFAYLEDIDLSFRFQLAGFRCLYNPRIVCYHKRGKTVKQFSGWETYFSERNLVALRIKDYPLWIYIKYMPLFLVARVRRYAKFLLFYPRGIFVAALKGYFNGLLRTPASLRKRLEIQKRRKVTSKYIESLFK